MPRNVKITLAIFLVAVLGSAIYFHGLHRQILRLAHLDRGEDRARREVIHPVLASQGDKGDNQLKTTVFWASREDPRKLAAVVVYLPEITDGAERARLALETLIASPPDPSQRTLPADTVLLALYLLRDGTAVADFSDALSNETPAGISSEQLAIDSIARTLHASLPAAQRLRILIQGQEVETLAGHVDLTGAFNLVEEAPAAPEPAPAPVKPARKAKAARALTPPAAPGKLKP